MRNEGSNTLSSAQNLIALLNLTPEFVKDISLSRTEIGLEVNVELVPREHDCRLCQTPTSSIKGYVYKKIKHQILNKQDCTINYKARRYVCNHCKKTFYEEHPFNNKHSNLSATTVYNVLADLRSANETYSSVAKKYFISPTTVINLFDTYVKIPRQKLPKILCIDEVYVRKGIYATVLVNFETQEVVDIIDSRKKIDLLDYFYRIPVTERRQVQYLCADMWETYHDLTAVILPNAKPVVDKFHVVALLNKQLRKLKNRVHKQRVRERDKFEKNSYQFKELDKDCYLLSKFGWMLNYTNSFDPNKEKKYNHKFQQYLNYDDISRLLQGVDDDIHACRNLLHYLSVFFKKSDYESGLKNIDEIINHVKKLDIPELKGFANTLSRWKRPIVNSLIVVDTVTERKYDSKRKKMIEITKEIKVHNGVAENKNKTIKLLKRNGNGFGNWDRFRNRAMYVINKSQQETSLIVYHPMPYQRKERQKKGANTNDE